jgi:ABC-2 type transport system permease protein
MSSASLLPARTPGSAFVKLVETEARIAWRVPVGLVFGVAIPVLLLIILGGAPSMNHPIVALGGLTTFTVFFPILVAFVLAGLSLFGLPMHLATYRNQGILRRLGTTPVPPAWMLAANVVVNLLLASVAFIILVVVGSQAYGLAGPKDPASFVLFLALVVAAMFAIGLWIAAISRSAVVAGAIGTVFFYPLMFTAGLYVPQGEMSASARSISHLSPLGAAVQGMQGAMQGTGFSVEAVVVLMVWAIVFCYLAVRFFRWS